MERYRRGRQRAKVCRMKRAAQSQAVRTSTELSSRLKCSTSAWGKITWNKTFLSLFQNFSEPLLNLILQKSSFYSCSFKLISLFWCKFLYAPDNMGISTLWCRPFHRRRKLERNERGKERCKANSTRQSSDEKRGVCRLLQILQARARNRLSNEMCKVKMCRTSLLVR